jgi:hypothetical protein
MFTAVSRVLQNIASDGRADGDTAFSYLSSFEFILVLCVMQEILEIAEDLSQALQKKSQDIVNAMRLVFSTTSGKKGFHSPPLVPNLIDPRLKGPSVPVHLKMWARGH